MTNIFKRLRRVRPDLERDRANKGTGGQLDLWCPFAEIVTPHMKTRGKYRRGYPEGAVVHYTAGRWGSGAVAYGREKGYCYLLIDEHGVIYQSSPLDEWGYHAGKSEWAGEEGVSRRLIGIEVACPGKLENMGGVLRTWWGEAVAPKRVRTVSPKRDNIAEGSYFAFTPQQEESLTNLLLWLKSNNPYTFKLENVVGHDEVSPGRKTDPGGSLRVTMSEFREQLKLRQQSREHDDQRV